MKVLVLYDYSRYKHEPTASDGKVIVVKSSRDILDTFLRQIAKERYLYCQITGYVTETGEQFF